MKASISIFILTCFIFFILLYTLITCPVFVSALYIQIYTCFTPIYIFVMLYVYSYVFDKTCVPSNLNIIPLDKTCVPSNLNIITLTSSVNYGGFSCFNYQGLI